MLAAIQFRTFLHFPVLSKKYVKAHKIIIFPVILGGGDSLSRILSEERGLKAYKNSVLRNLGPKRDEIVGGWRKLHNEERHDT
jgi:hypothetical protein